MKNKQYWCCIIGGVPMKKLGFGADGPLRSAVRNKFNEIFGPDDVCSSGWGIDQERKDILTSLHNKSTEELKKLLNTKKNIKKISSDRWIKFKGQKLKTGDLLLTQNGLAFVDSGYTDKTPSRITSIPESWSFTFENGGINQRSKVGESNEYILPNGEYYFTKINGKPQKAGKINYIRTLKTPKKITKK